MSIGFGIFLMAVGAILAFGVRDRSGSLDLSVVGVIIMIAGAAGIWLSYSITNKRRRVETQAIDPAVEEEYRDIRKNTSDHTTSTEQPPASGPTHTPAPDAAPDPTPADETEVERHVDLNPAASGLLGEVPDRSLPRRTERERRADDQPAPNSLRARLAGRFRARR